MPVLPLPEIIGFIGVSILLAAFLLNLAGFLLLLYLKAVLRIAAFLLNLAGFLLSTSKRYLLLNFIGAALAGYSSWLIGFMPFVLLEGTWAVVALLTLARQMFAYR